MNNEPIVLIVKQAVERNEDGADVFVDRETEVYAYVQSVKRAEFYMANRSGIDLALTAEVNLVDYEEAFWRENGKKHIPSFVRFDGELFKIERAYGKNKHKIELMLSRVL